ncbi:MAG: dienelactone hydrolase family protein [Bacteroidota bacterium]
MKTKTTFMMLFLGLYLIACGPAEEKKTEEDTDATTKTEEPAAPNVVGEEITYSTDSTEMKGYIAYDASKEGPRPGILVVHEWWGHNEYARKRADMLAELGYVALAVDMYGDGQTADHPDDAGNFAGMVFQNIDEAKARFIRAMETLKSNANTDGDKIAAIGYCFGGSVALSMANAGMDLDGVVAFHSGVALPIQPDSGAVKAKIIVCNGADDTFIKPEHITAYKASMDAAGADYQYIAYPGAVHSFTNPGADTVGTKFNLPLAYNQEADQKSWEEMKKLFEEIF